jgi:MFS family permease
VTETASRGFSDRFRALRHPNFRLYWGGQLVSLVGTWMQSVAQGWLMHRLTSSAFMLGLLSFMQFLPVLLLALWAGVIVDRVDRRKLILITQCGFLVQATLLALLTSTGHVRPWMILGLAFFFGLFNAFDLPSRQSFVIELVGGREDLSNGIALNSAAFNAARIVGPAVAGVLVATIGEQGCFWINALSYVAVIASLLALKVAPREPSPGAGDAMAFLREGVSYAWNTRGLRNLLLLLGVCAGIGFQYMVLLPVYARDILRSGAQTYGLMVAAFGIGSLASAVLMTRRLDRATLRRQLLIGLTLGGVGLALFAWSRVLALTLVGGLLSGFGLILYVSSTNVLIQMTTEDRFRGRVMSLYTLLFVGTAPLGALLTGTLAQHVSAPFATSFNAVVLLGGALWVSHRLRALAAATPPVEPPPPIGDSVR